MRTNGSETQTRVLVQLGGIPLWGQERGNIQVFNALKDVGVDSLFVTHKGYGHESIQPTLDRLGLRWTVGTYPQRIGKGMSSRQWAERLEEIARGNRDFYRSGRAYRPTHIHTCNEGHFLTSLPAIRALRVPVIFRLGDEPRQHSRLFRKVWRRAIIPTVSTFVCVSEFIRGRLLAAGASPERIRVIYTYPAERPARHPGEALGGSAGSTRGDDKLSSLQAVPFEGRTVAFMGQLSALKGVDLLVEAAVALCRERDEVRFLIAGDYSWQNPFAQRLMAEVEAAGLAERIRFIGFVDDVPRLLAASDLHVCPSVCDEALSNTVVEAKRARVPSIVFPSGGLPELIEDGVDGEITDAKSAAALTAALQRWLDSDPNLLRAAGEHAGASLARLGITKERFTQAWREVYASV
jgi:glycosyltransferase involved in cell wall biosynthesis